MAATIQPPTLNSPADAPGGLSALLDSTGGLSNVLVKVDATNLAHYDGEPAYRLARYVAAPRAPNGTTPARGSACTTSSAAS